MKIEYIQSQIFFKNLLINFLFKKMIFKEDVVLKNFNVQQNF